MIRQVLAELRIPGHVLAGLHMKCQVLSGLHMKCQVLAGLPINCQVRAGLPMNCETLSGFVIETVVAHLSLCQLLSLRMAPKRSLLKKLDSHTALFAGV